MTDKVNKPHHYVGSNGMEVEQFLKEFMTKEDDGYIAHRKASAIEYIIRAFHKEDGIEDINKAIKNLELIIEHMIVRKINETPSTINENDVTGLKLEGYTTKNNSITWEHERSAYDD